MALAAGKLRRRLTILRTVEVAPNAFNEKDEAFAPIATMRAAKQDVSDAERVRAAEVGATVTTRFQIRWNSLTATVDPLDRVECEGRTYDIIAVKEIGWREGVEITATARAERP